MFDQARYLTNSLVITFGRAAQIRREANTFEDRLTPHYGQPQVLPVPDELDPNVPRMIFSSTHGFSQIIVSQVSISLSVKYSPDWQTDITKGRAYLEERSALLFGLIADLDFIGPRFTGLTSQAHLLTGRDAPSITKAIHRAFLKGTLEGDFYTISLKLAKIHEERYFSNVTIENLRQWQVAGHHDGRLPIADATAQGIIVTGDFNDRYAFNEQPEYHTDVNAGLQVIERGLNAMEASVLLIQEEIEL